PASCACRAEQGDRGPATTAGRSSNKAGHARRRLAFIRGCDPPWGQPDGAQQSMFDVVVTLQVSGHPLIEADGGGCEAAATEADLDQCKAPKARAGKESLQQ